MNCSLDRVALIVQIHLQKNRTDLALKEVQGARRWAQDSLLVNLCESWVGLRVVCPNFLYHPGSTSFLFIVVILSSRLLMERQPSDQPTGRRKVPIRFLRLRGTRLRTRHIFTNLDRRPSHC